jgi:hypothetical protein
LAKQAQTDTDTIAATAKQELMRKFLSDHLDTQGLFVPGLGQEYYKFFNPSEWWAVNASELFAKANTKPELKTWLDKAKAFYAALMESVRKILGTSATAAIQKGLDTVLQGKTLDVSQETMLANINSSFDVQPQGVTQQAEGTLSTELEQLAEDGDGQPGSSIIGKVFSKSQVAKDSVISDINADFMYDDSNLPDNVTMPDRSTIEKVLEKSGGAAIFINSDGTKVGITKSNKELQGGWRYLFFEKNISDKIGFAATSEAHVGMFHKLLVEIANIRDKANPEMKGKPVAVFVTIQNADSMLGEWYAGEFFMEGIDAAIEAKKFKGGFKGARKLLLNALTYEEEINNLKNKINELSKNPSEANSKSIERFRKIIANKKELAKGKNNIQLVNLINSPQFETQGGRLEIAKRLASKEFSFKARVAFLSTVIPLKSVTGGSNRELKQALQSVNYDRKAFYEEFLDEALLEKLKQTDYDEKSIGGVVLGGFYADPNVSKEEFIENKNNGIEHAMFNESFSSNGETFRLTNAYDVNKIFPSMGFPVDKAYSVYNEANNTNLDKSATLEDKQKISQWLYENGRKNLINNPFASISGTMYTSFVDIDYQKADENLGIEDGGPFQSKSQYSSKELNNLSETISKRFNDTQLETLKGLINRGTRIPQNTKTAYKLFKVKKEFPGELFPLFVGANESVTTSEWIQAKAGELTQTKEGKTMVKSKLGPLAYRPGWHSGDLAVATHIGAKRNASDKAPSLRAEDQVWAEVEVGNDVDWQSIANERAQIGKNGEPIAKTAHITDQVPTGGSYRYKTNSNMTGSWIISGEMKVNRILTDAEVEQINSESGAKDLPRTKPFDFAAYGFNSNGSVSNPKKVLANQIARAYLNAKETGENQELVDAVEMKRSQPQFKSKSQLDFTQIRPEYDAVMNQQFGTKEAAYRALIEKGYTPKRIKEAIGLYDFDETAFKKAQSQIAVNAINTVAQTYNVRQDEIKDAINQNLGDVESIYQDLIDEGYSNLEIFTAVTDMDFLSPQELIDIFGAEYRQTVKRAIDASTPYPTDFLDELESDARTLKVSQKAADIADVVREAGLGIVDSAVAIDSLLEFMKTNGFDQLAIALTEGVKRFGQDRTKFDKTLDWADQVRSGQVGDNLYTPEAINYAFSVSSELFSQAGRILQLARYFNETNQLAMIERQLAASGVVLTEMQKKTLESLVNDYKTAQADNKEKLKALQEDWSDQAYEAFNKSEEAVGIATIRVAQFLEARKPIFWNERLTSGAARALLNVSTAVLSFVANIENNIWSTNFVARTIQKLRDVIGSGIKGNTLSLSNWKMARKLTSKRMWFDMNNNAKFGVMDTSKGLNKYYDNLAQVNFFRDVKWNYNFMKAMVKKVLNRDFESMTPEEQADAYDLTLVKLKNDKIELRDGKTYTFARSLAWSLGTGPFLAARQSNASLLMNTGGPLFAEATGRIMSYGGDIAFGYMAAQRAMIDYFQNIQGTRFQDGIFGSMLENADGKLDEKTIRALSEILRADGELYARFEQEGLKRTLLGDNMLSGVISLGRGQLRKKIRTLYTENRKQNSGSTLFGEFKREFLTGTGLYKNALQVLDVGFFTLMPFTKVPVNFLGSAIVKVVPYAAGAKYILAEGIYQYKYKKFNEKYDGIPALKTDKERRDYEKAKIDLFSAKRQATYDVAQFVTSIAIYGFAMSAVKAGAVLVGGSDEEKEKAFKLYGLKSGLYNATLHMEYLAAGMPSNFLARRGGFAKPGDVMLNTNNAGFLGYAMGLYGSVYEGKLKQEANNTLSLFDEQKSAMTMLLTNTLSSGVETLPMFQGLARIGEAMNSFKKEDATAGLKTFVSGSLSTSMAVFFPSFFSFMSKGNAEMIQSTSDINKRAENLDWFMGDIGIRVIQKLNRNISFNENTRNDYYKAQIGPFGEDLSYKVTVAEPGTAGAYVQAFIDPFAIRTFASPSKQQQQEIQKYRESSQLFGEMVNLALTFKQITGQDFEWKVDGKTSSFFNIITNPMANKFPFAAGAENVGGLDEPNTYKLFEYSLPNDLYRKELMIRGEEYRSAMRKYIGLFADVRSQVQTAIEQGDEQRARRLITDMFEQYQSEVTETQENYLSDYVRNREKKYLITLRDRKLITEEEKKIMIKSGFMTPEGLIP